MNYDWIKLIQECRSKAEARQLMRLYVAEIAKSKPELTYQDARTTARENIGYITGYLSAEEGSRILKLFKTQHPVFGTTRPTPEKAFAMGLKVGEELRQRRRRTESDT